jgi:hypothetical protein
VNPICGPALHQPRVRCEIRWWRRRRRWIGCGTGTEYNPPQVLKSEDRVRGEGMTRLIFRLLPTPMAAQGMRVETFAQEVRAVYGSSNGLPSDDVRSVRVLWKQFA